MNEGELVTQSIAGTISGIGLGMGAIGAAIGLGAAVVVLVALLAGNPRAMSLGLSFWLVGSIMGFGFLVVGLWPFTVLVLAAAPAVVILGVAVRLMLVGRRSGPGRIGRSDRLVGNVEALAS